MRVSRAAVAAVALALVGSGCTTIVRSSVASDGTGPNSGAGQYASMGISDTGRYVVFGSYATNLVPNDTNGRADVFRHDNQTGTTVRVSMTNSGAQISGDSSELAISGDGDHVLFMTTVPLETADTNGNYDVFVRTVSTGETDWVSIRPDGTPILDPPAPPPDGGLIQTASISDDGSRVLISASGARPGLFLRDLNAGATAVLGGLVLHAILSGNGTSMVVSEICNTENCPHRSFVTPVDLSTPPVEIDTQCGFQAFDISSDARYVVGYRFGLPPSWACPDPIGMVRWDRTTKTFTGVALPLGRAPMLTTSISNDGRFVSSVVDDDVVRVFDLTTGVVQIPDADTWGVRGPGPDYAGAISGNGRYIAISSLSQLVPDDTDEDLAVYTTFTMRPVPATVVPSSVARGAAHVVLTITGTELLSGLTATVAGTGVTVNSVTLQSPTQMKADISVTAGAPVGARNVVISNTGGFGHSDALCAGCLTVT
jgi:hypothetical protein